MRVFHRVSVYIKNARRAAADTLRRNQHLSPAAALVRTHRNFRRIGVKLSTFLTGSTSGIVPDMERLAHDRRLDHAPLARRALVSRRPLRGDAGRLCLLVVGVALLAACSSPTSPTPIAPSVSVPPVTVTPPVDDPRLDRAFYRQLVHNAFERPGLTPLARWTRAPLVYLRTIDEAGNAVDPRLLDQTAAAIINTTSQWTGGHFGVAGLERGRDTREGHAGWLTVKWTTTGVCGTVDRVGTEGNAIAMNHRRPECTCGPLVVKHELGHAMGFYHTDSPNDLMTATFTGCDKALSPREVYHAERAYARPVGSLDP